MQTIRVICGPTASGKSALAMRLAATTPVTIISADSRQIYRGFDIGTAKPTREDRALVPHRGIDIIPPGSRYSAAAWADAAVEWIEEAHAAARVPVIVGGTGFYLRALFDPLFHEPALPAKARQALETALAQMPLDELRRWCTALDPARAHLGRTQLLRAIEVALLTGERLSDLHGRVPRAPRYAGHYLVVDPGAALGERIEQRVLAMLAGGWEDEVRVLARTVPDDAPAWHAAGYRWVRALLNGEIDRTAAVARIVIDTRQYAKRQRTWFRHQLDSACVTHVNPDDPDHAEIVRRWWSGAGEGKGDE